MEDVTGVVVVGRGEELTRVDADCEANAQYRPDLRQARHDVSHAHPGIQSCSGR